MPGEEALPGVLLRLVDSIGLDEPNRPGREALLKVKIRDYRDIARDRGAAPLLARPAGELEELAARLA